MTTPLKGFRRAATKGGPILVNPASIGNNNGLYYPSAVRGSDIPNWPSEWHTLVFVSTDHDSALAVQDGGNPVTGGAGGIWLFCCNGDPSLSASWSEWDEISSNDEFSYLPGGTPSGNPIYRDTKQTETPFVQVVNGTVILMYHDDDSANYEGFSTQNTAYATSSDGINYTKQGINITYDPRYNVGQGHTGYPDGGTNKFPFIPETYIGRCLHGGGGSTTVAGGERAYIVSNDGINWEFHSYYGAAIGRLEGFIPDPSFTYQYAIGSLHTAVKEGPYWRVIGVASRQGVSGASPTSAKVIEVLIDDDFQIVSQPLISVDVGDTGEFDEAATSVPTFFVHDGVEYGVYTGSDSSDVNSISVLTINTVPATWQLLDPLNNNKTVLYDEHWAETGVVSASTTTVGGTSSMATPPNFLRIQADLDDTCAVFPNQSVVIADHSIVDFYFEGLAQQGILDLRRSFGIVNAQAISGYVQSIIILPDDATIHSPLRMQYAGNGSVINSAVTTKYIGWRNSWEDNGEESPQADQHLTLRIIPSLDLAILMVGSTELDTLDITGFDYTSEVYGMARVKNAESGNRWMSIKRMTATAGDDIAVAVPSTPANLDITPEDTQLDITYNSVSGATGYKVYVDGLETDLGNVTSHSITGLTNARTYEIYVRAYNALGDSEPTDVQNAAPTDGVAVAPLVDAGNDQNVLPGDDVTLVAVGTVQTGGNPITGYRWEQIQGDTPTLNGINTDTLEFTVPNGYTSQTLIFQAYATDGTIESSPDSVSVNVGDVPNTGPTADAGPDQLGVNDAGLPAGSTVVLDSSGSTDDTLITQRTWTKISGQDATLSDVNAIAPEFVAPSSGSVSDLVFQVEVEDAEGLTDTDTVQIRIAPVATTPTPTPTPSAAPTITMSQSPSTSIVGQQLTFTASATNTDSITWAAEGITLDANTGNNVTATPIVAGTFTVSATATGAGGETIANLEVVVGAGTPTPTPTPGGSDDAVYELIKFDINLAAPRVPCSNIRGSLYDKSDTKIIVTINDGWFNPRQFSEVRFGMFQLDGVTPLALKSLGLGISLVGNAIEIVLSANDLPTLGKVYFEIVGEGLARVNLTSGYLNIVQSRL